MTPYFYTVIYTPNISTNLFFLIYTNQLYSDKKPLKKIVSVLDAPHPELQPNGLSLFKGFMSQKHYLEIDEML